MVKVFEGTPNEYYMDGYEKSNLDTGKKVVKKDWDMIFLVDGIEGAGKSVKASQAAYYCDETLDLSRVVFTPVEFQRVVLSATKYQSVVYDEAYTGLSSRAAMSMVNRILVKMLAEIRQKNLFIFVVMPTFFDLDKYVALWRSRALFHVFTGDNFERGYFAFYNADRKKDLYINGKKYYSYYKPKPNFIGRFTNHYVFDEAEYRKKKLQSTTKREDDIITQQIKAELSDDEFKRVVSIENDKFTHEMRAAFLGIPISTYYYKLRKFEENRDFT